MQPRNQHSDFFDHLVGETLREQMGPAPVHEVWEAVRRQIAVAPVAMEPAAPLRPASLTWLQRLLRLGFETPLARGALTIALFGFILLLQPELETLWRPVPTLSPVQQSQGGPAAPTPPSVMRDVAFERLFEADGKWALAPSELPATARLQPIANPGELQGQVRPDQPVLLATSPPRVLVGLMPGRALSGGARQ